MGSNIRDIANVLLSPASDAYRFTANSISWLTINDGSSTTADTLTAGGTHQTLAGGGAGKVEFVDPTAGDHTVNDLAALFNGDIVASFDDNGDIIDLPGPTSEALEAVRLNGG
jgi:hypothetical protein